MNTDLVAGALRALANALQTPAAVPLDVVAPAPPAVAPVPRGRGRPPKAEVTPPVAPEPVHVAPVAVEVDPFAPAAPRATGDDVRAALSELRAATTQDNALAVLLAAGFTTTVSGPSGLNPALYDKVVAAAKAAMPTKAVAEVDPFEVAAGPALVAAMGEPISAMPESAPNFEDLSAAIVDAQKRTNVDAAQKIVMQHGGVAANPATGVKGASLKALPLSKYAEVIAALKALPSTK